MIDELRTLREWIMTVASDWIAAGAEQQSYAAGYIIRQIDRLIAEREREGEK